MALSKGRDSKRREGKHLNFPVAGSATIYVGGMVTLLTTGGFAVPAGTASAGMVVGVARETINGGGSNGLNRIEVDRGCFHFKNSASGDLITHVDIGLPCYIVDDETVAKTDNSAARKIAGCVIDVDAQGVWVDCGPGAVS